MFFGDKMKKVERATEKRKSKQLIELAQCKKNDVRLAAIRGLGKSGGEEAINFLVTQLRNAAIFFAQSTVFAFEAFTEGNHFASRDTSPPFLSALLSASS